MKLIGSTTSPYVRKARLVLLEKNIPHTFLINSPHEPNNDVAQFNPLGRVPALILDDGTCVFDSTVIAEYADTLNDTPILIPRNNALARMHVRRGEALADGIMDSAIVVRMERIRPEGKQEQANIDLHYSAITRTLEHIAGQLGQNEWCVGDNITLADLALLAALVYLDLRQPERDWRAAHPNLATWFNRLGTRPSVKAALAE
jgi:glutathione S-transferase